MISRDDAKKLADAAAKIDVFPENLVGSAACFQNTLKELDLFAAAINMYDQTLEADAQKTRKDFRELHPPLLIRGEPGTGKTLYAHRLRNSINNEVRRSNFNKYESSLLTTEKLLSDFASRVKEMCSSARECPGVIFLDEIGKLEPTLQTNLNAIITDGIHIDEAGARANIVCIATTNQILESRVAIGSYDNDLLMRFSSFTVKIPTLRDMREDIPILIQFFLHKYGYERYGVQLSVSKNISPDALVTLLNYDWPGNGWELALEIQRLIPRLILRASIEPVIELTMLNDSIRSVHAGAAIMPSIVSTTTSAPLILEGPYQFHKLYAKIVASNGMTVDIPPPYAYVLNALFDRDVLIRSGVKSSLTYDEVAEKYVEGKVVKARSKSRKSSAPRLMALASKLTERIQNSPEKVAQQFARAFRSFLKVRGIMARDAIIICDKSSGCYRLGNGWDKKKPLLDKAEASLVFRENADADTE